MADQEADSPQVAAGFLTAAIANRRVAGVAAAARAARDLIEDGASAVWLVIEDGGTLDEGAWRDMRRLCGTVEVSILGPREARLPGIPAPTITTWEVLLATGKSSDGLVARVLNRPISRCCSALLMKLPGIEPAHATIGTAVISGIMFVALVFGGATGLIAGGLLFQAASIFDGVDGEIARATYRVSPAGASLDSAVDVLTNLLFVLGLTINLSISTGVVAAALGTWSLSMLAMGFWLIGRRKKVSGGPLHFDWLKQHVRRESEGTRTSRFLGRLATFLSTRDSIAFFFMFMILAGLAMPALCVLTLAATIWIGVLLTALATAKRNGTIMAVGTNGPEAAAEISCK